MINDNKIKTAIFSSSIIILNGIITLVKKLDYCELLGATSDIFKLKKMISSDEKCVLIISCSIDNGNADSIIDTAKTLRPNADILFISQNEDLFYAEDIIRSGALGYITVNTDELPDAIKAVNENRIFIDKNFKEIILRKLLGKSISSVDEFEESLSPREKSVFKLLGQGYKITAIATNLSLSAKTIGTYVTNIKDKLNLDSTDLLISYAIHWNCRHNRSQNFLNDQ